MLRLFARLSLLGALLGALPAPARADDERTRAVAELAELAPRIEALKREAQAGRDRSAELQRLLARAQVLADRLDRPAPATAPRLDAGPDGRELRERADALRDRADRLAAALGAVEERLRAARRQGELADALDRVSGSFDPFTESAARRPAAAATDATTGSAAPPGPAVLPVPPVAGAQARPAAAAQAPPWAASPERAAEGLLPAEGDGPGALRRKRAALGAALAGLRAQAEALEDEARALDAGR